jgi:hypothetical protein
VKISLPIVFFAYSTSAQTNSETLIVFQITQDNFIVAADSRRMVNGIPDDSYRKIVAFNDEIVFLTLKVQSQRILAPSPGQPGFPSGFSARR